MMKRKGFYDEGTLMLEAVFSMTIILFVMIALISFGFYLYQFTTIQYVCNEVSEEVAMTYKFPNASTAAEITDSEIKQVSAYRYSIHKAAMRDKNESNVKVLMSRRLPQTALAKAVSSEPTVTINKIGDDIGRAHYEITVTQNYVFLWGGALKWFGIDASKELSATSYVEAVDVSTLVNHVKLTKYAISEIEGYSSVLTAISTVLSTVNSIYGAITAFTN